MKSMEMKKQLLEIFFTEPNSGEHMFFSGAIINNNDGSFSFEMENKDNTIRFKHTIKTDKIIDA